MRQPPLAHALLAALVLIIAACGKQEPTPPPAQIAAPVKRAPVIPSPEGRTSPDITAEDFAARVQKISGDAFEGRKPGTVGERMTTAWMKDQFEQIGLKPGNKGNWFQTVPMVETTLLEPDAVKLDVTAKAGDERFAYRTDMIVNSLDASPAVEIANSPMVFVGYGVVAPEQNWNDYAGLDVKGKTVIVLVNDPGWGNHDETLFKGKALTYYGRWTYKYEEAARQGAAARRDRAFSIFYVGINLGAFLAPLVCGTLGEEVGWHYGFAAAGVGMCIGLCIYLYALRLLPPDELEKAKKPHAPSQPLTRDEWRAILALLVLFIPNSLFWATYEQMSNTIVLWADANTDRTITLFAWQTNTDHLVPRRQSVHDLCFHAVRGHAVGAAGGARERSHSPSPKCRLAVSP